MRDLPPPPAARRPGSRPAGTGPRASRARWHRALAGATALAIAGPGASAYTLTLNPGAPQTVYLQVGVGSFTANYNVGGQPQNNATINTVSTSVPAAAVGDGTAQTMTTNSTATQSFLDGYTFCSVPGQLYIGGFYRTAGGATAAARVTATVPTALVNATGNSIPFSQIRWTSSGNGDSGTEVFPGGTFVAGGVQTVGLMASNSWNESCWAFSYVNSVVPPAGTFTGRVLYTLSSP